MVPHNASELQQSSFLMQATPNSTQDDDVDAILSGVELDIMPVELSDEYVDVQLTNVLKSEVNDKAVVVAEEPQPVELVDVVTLLILLDSYEEEGADTVEDKIEDEGIQTLLEPFTLEQMLLESQQWSFAVQTAPTAAQVLVEVVLEDLEDDNVDEYALSGVKVEDWTVTLDAVTQEE